MPPVTTGISFGASVWSYGSLEAFTQDFNQTRTELSAPTGEGTGVPRSPTKPRNEPVDTGITRYLGSMGDEQLKIANLNAINLFVSNYKYEHGGILPEAQQSRTDGCCTPDELAKKFFPGAGDRDLAEQTLVRMLEKKTLAAKQAVPGQKTAQLSDQEMTAIRNNCHLALEKALVAGSLAFDYRELGGPDVRIADREALLNTALGIAELLQTEKIDADAVVTLVQRGALMDLTNDLDVTRMLHQTAVEMKEAFTHEKALGKEIAKLPDGNQKKLLQDLVTARQKFTRVLEFEIHEHDPDGKLSDEKFLAKQLQDVKLRLQQFRYDLERCTGDVGKEYGHKTYSFYGVMEKLRRACSNRLGDRHLDVRFKTDADRNAAFAELKRLEGDLEVRAALKSMIRQEPEDLFVRAQSVCQTTHAANAAARANQAVAHQRRAFERYGNKVLDMIQTGASRTVETTRSADASVGIGSEKVAGAHVSAGYHQTESVTLSANPNGTFTITVGDVKGGHASVGAGALDEHAKAEAGIRAEGGSRKTYTFNNRTEVFTFCRQNEPGLLQAIAGALVGSGKDFQTLKNEALPRTRDAIAIFRDAGKFLGNLLGLRVHKTKNFSEVAFEKRMRKAGVLDNLNALLASRQNAQAISVSKKSVVNVAATASAEVDFSTEVISNTAGASGSVTGSGGKITSKKLQTAEAVFRHHTAREMKEHVLGKEIQTFNDNQEDCEKAKIKPDGNWEDLPDELTELTKGPPAGASVAERARYWRQCVDGLAWKFTEVEDFYHEKTGKDTITDEPSAQTFANVTRLIAVHAEYAAKCIEGELARLPRNGSDASRAPLRIALKTVRQQLAPRLAAPRLGIDLDIFQETLQFGREISEGKYVTFDVSAEAHWDLMGKKTEEDDEGVPGALEAFKDALTTDVTDQYKGFVSDVLHKLTLASGKVSGSLTGTSFFGTSESLRPWTQVRTLDISLDIGSPLNPLKLVETVCRLVKKAAAKRPEDKALAQNAKMIATEFATEIGKGLKTLVLNEADKTIENVLDSVAKMPVRVALNALNKGLGLLGASVAVSSEDKQTRGTKLTLHFDGTAFTQCSMADYVSNVSTESVKLKIPFHETGLSYAKTESAGQQNVKFLTLPHPTFATILKRVDDVRKANGANASYAIRAFLRSFQSATNKIVKNLRNTTDAADVAYQDDQLQAIRKSMEFLRQVGESTDAAIPLKLRNLAQARYGVLFGQPDGVWTKLAAPAAPGETDEARVELLAKLAETVTDTYGLLDDAQRCGWEKPHEGR